MMNPQYFFLPILQYIYYSNTHCEEILITPTFLWYNHTRKTRKTVVGDDSMIKKTDLCVLVAFGIFVFFILFFYQVLHIVASPMLLKLHPSLHLYLHYQHLDSARCYHNFYHCWGWVLL